MGLYEELKARKESGEILGFEALSDAELERLWWDENRSDSMIAELFDVPKSRVASRRKRLGLNVRNMCLMKAFSEFLASPQWREIAGGATPMTGVEPGKREAPANDR